MIVITYIKKKTFKLRPGDTFDYVVNKGSFQVIEIKKDIKEKEVIDFICIVHHALEDGTHTGLLPSGYCGNSKNMPEVLKDAKLLTDLSDEQHSNFISSCPDDSKGSFEDSELEFKGGEQIYLKSWWERVVSKTKQEEMECGTV